MLEPLLLVVGVVVGLIVPLGVVFPSVLLGLVIINEQQVGIVIKNFGSKSLPHGKLIALNGEPGYQADTLPPGWHFGYWSWKYTVKKVAMIVIPQGEIGLVVASDGVATPSDRIMAREIGR